MKEMGFEEIMSRLAQQSAGTDALQNTQLMQELIKIVAQTKNALDINQKEFNKRLNDYTMLLRKTGADKEEIKQLVKTTKEGASAAIGSNAPVSLKALDTYFTRKVNEAVRNKTFTVTNKMKKGSPLAVSMEKELKKDVIRQEESKQLKTTMEKIQYTISGFIEDSKSSEPRKRKRFIDDLVDAIGQNKSIVGVFTDMLKIVTLFSANWLRKFGTLGKVLGAAFILAGPTIAMFIGKKLLEVIGKAFGLLRLTPIPVVVMGYLGKGIVKGAPLTKADAVAGKTAMTGARALGRTGIAASQLTRTVPQSASALRSAIVLGGASAIGAASTSARTFKVTSGAGTLAKKLGSPAMTKAATKAGGKLAAKAGGRFAALIPGAAVASGAALTVLSGKMAWDSFKEGDMVGGAAFGVSTIASLVQMLAGNIPGIGTAVSAIAGAIGFIADMVGFFHKEIGEFIKGFWDKFKNTLFSFVKGLWDGLFNNSGIFGSPAGAYTGAARPETSNTGVSSMAANITVPSGASDLNGVQRMAGSPLKFNKEGYVTNFGKMNRSQAWDAMMAWKQSNPEEFNKKYEIIDANAYYTDPLGKKHKGSELISFASMVNDLSNKKGNGTATQMIMGKGFMDKYMQDVYNFGKERGIKNPYNYLKITSGIGTASGHTTGGRWYQHDNPLGFTYDVTGGMMENYISWLKKTYPKSAGKTFAHGSGTGINAWHGHISTNPQDLRIKEEPKKAEAPKEDKSVKVAEEPNKSTQVLQGSFPQGTSNAQAPALPKVDFSGTRTASNILNGVTNIVNVGADAAYQIV